MPQNLKLRSFKWSGYHGEFSAVTPFGTYSVFETGDGFYMQKPLSTQALKVGSSLEEGVAAVNADILQIIENALQPDDWLEETEQREKALETIVAPDNGTVEEVLEAVRQCARAWVPEARIIGNVRAGDIARAADAIIVTLKEEAEVREALDRIADQAKRVIQRHKEDAPMEAVMTGLADCVDIGCAALTKNLGDARQSLVWNPCTIYHPYGVIVSSAETPFGKYHVVRGSQNRFEAYFANETMPVSLALGSEELGRNAAQEDYECRIGKALRHSTHIPHNREQQSATIVEVPATPEPSTHLEAENAELRGALEWYADEVMAYSITQASEPRSAVHGDRGARARAVLDKYPATATNVQLSTQKDPEQPDIQKQILDYIQMSYDLSTWAACINWEGKENQKEWLDDLREKIEAVQEASTKMRAAVAHCALSLQPNVTVEGESEFVRAMIDAGVYKPRSRGSSTNTEAVEIIREMVRLADMGFDESMKEPEENGNFAVYERAKQFLADHPSPKPRAE